MTYTPLCIRKAAVLGAGVMGAQIAAHLANANVKPILFDLPAKEGKDKSAIAGKAIEGLAKQNPSPLATASAQKQIVAANYDEHLHLLADCDLVIEAISERMDWKKSLFEKVAPHIGPNAIFASNTSGLSITELAKTLPPELRKRFCGIHFFNPPRYMRLVELVPTGETEPVVMDQLETFCSTRGCTLLELAFGWLAAQPVVSSVIAGATKPDQLEANARAVELELSAQDLAEIDRLIRD